MEPQRQSVFINRELSWLDFDRRVLALGKEKSVPLAEVCGDLRQQSGRVFHGAGGVAL